MMMMKKNASREQSLAAISKSVAGEDAVRKRAYELYVDRGMDDGHDLEDWFRAEQELAGRRSQSVAA